MRTVLIAAIVGVLASAATATASHLITGRDVQNNSLTGADIRNGSIRSSDLKRGAVTERAISAETAQQLQATVATTKVSQSEPIVITPNDYNPKSLTVSCPEGQVALGGGGGFVQRPDLGSIGTNRPVLDGQGVARGWQVGGRPGSQSSAPEERLEVYAICSL